VVYLVPINKAVTTESCGITVSSGMQEMASQNTAAYKLRVAVLPLDLPCSGFVNSFRGNSNKWQVSQATQDNKENTHPKADGSREDHWRDFRMLRDERVNKWSKSMI
jgi:hypothetical protein